MYARDQKILNFILPIAANTTTPHCQSMPEFPPKKLSFSRTVIRKSGADRSRNHFQNFFQKRVGSPFGGSQYVFGPSLAVFCNLTTSTPAWSNVGQMWSGRMQLQLIFESFTPWPHIGGVSRCHGIWQFASFLATGLVQLVMTSDWGIIFYSWIHDVSHFFSIPKTQQWPTTILNLCQRVWGRYSSMPWTTITKMSRSHKR